MLNPSATAALLLAFLLAVLAFRWLARPEEDGRRAVERLWRTGLPAARAATYDEIITQADSVFVMFGVALNDALTVRRDEPTLAARLLEMSADLLERFLNALTALSQVLIQSSDRLHRWPEVRPLATDNFRSASAVALARWQVLLHTILLSSRMRFLQKLGGIERLGGQLAEEYEAAVADVVVGGAQAARGWQALDDVHYDLNTLWQELQIVFKALLHFTPDEVASALPAQFRVEFERRAEAARVAPRPAHIRAR